MSRLRRYTVEEQGYTLIELLVVIAIIGVLAAIALPAFLNQKNKATDVSAKTVIQTAEIAAETYSTDNNGSYGGLTASSLNRVEPTINISPGGGVAYVSGVTGVTATGYTITATPAGGGETFSLTRSNGATIRSCTPATGIHGGCTNGTW